MQHFQSKASVTFLNKLMKTWQSEQVAYNWLVPASPVKLSNPNAAFTWFAVNGYKRVLNEVDVLMHVIVDKLRLIKQWHSSSNLQYSATLNKIWLIWCLVSSEMLQTTSHPPASISTPHTKSLTVSWPIHAPATQLFTPWWHRVSRYASRQVRQSSPAGAGSLCDCGKAAGKRSFVSFQNYLRVFKADCCCVYPVVYHPSFSSPELLFWEMPLIWDLTAGGTVCAHTESFSNATL